MIPHVQDDTFLFLNDEDARRKMTAYIREHFSDLLGEDVRLLSLPNGLDIIQSRINGHLLEEAA